MRYHFFTFGNAPWRTSVTTLCEEARELGLFDVVRGYTEDDLSAEDRAYSDANPRGYGFWRWKPAICVKHLEIMAEGDVALYADAGCVFNPPAKGRLLEYADFARKEGIVGFQMTHTERQWTKCELLKMLQCDQRKDILDSGQIEATAFVFAKTEHAERILRTWNAIPRWNPVAINDTVQIQQDSAFRGHRHDQSIFSLLLKLYGAKVLAWETWCWGATESEYAQYPIWESRRKLQRRIPVLMSGPIRPTEDAVLKVIENTRTEIPGCEIFLCTWRGQVTPRIQAAVDHLVEVDEPTGEEIARIGAAMTIQCKSMPELPREQWWWGPYRMFYGVRKLCEYAADHVTDSDIVVRRRTDHYISFPPGYFQQLYSSCERNNSYVVRQETGVDWFCITSFKTFKDTWVFKTIDEYNNAVGNSFNIEACIQRRIPTHVEYYDKSLVDEYIIRGHTNQRFP